MMFNQEHFTLPIAILTDPMRQFLVTLNAMLACAIVCLILSHARIILIETRQHMDQIKIIPFGQWCNNIEECGRARFGYFIVENEHFIWHCIISCILFAFVLFFLKFVRDAAQRIFQSYLFKKIYCVLNSSKYLI